MLFALLVMCVSILPPSAIIQGEPAKVVRVLAVSGPETDALIKESANFEKESGIVASIEQVARPLWNERKVRELVQDAGIHDVVMIGGGDDLLWVKTNAHWLPLNKYISADDQKLINHLDYFVKDGNLMGMPQYYNFPMLFYRKDLLENPTEQANFKAKYGHDLKVPTNYDELFQVAEFFNRPPQMYGFFIGGVDWSISLDHSYFLYGTGANYGDEKTGALTLNTDEQKRAMTALTRMLKFNPPGADTMSFFDGDTLMQKGQIFMYQNWFYIWQTFQQTMSDKVGMAPAVGDKQPSAALGSFVAVIPQAAPNPDNGGAFIKWMMSTEYQTAQTLETGDLPIRNDVLENADVQKKLVGLDQMEKSLPYLTYNQTTWSAELYSGVVEAIYKVQKGEMTADQAVDWLQNTKFAGRKAIEGAPTPPAP